MTTEQGCSVLVFGDYRSSRCSRKAVVVRDGKPYCKQHDPEERKRRIDEERAKRETVCWYREGYGPACGKPAVTNKYGSGRCADHTEEALAARQRLTEAAPDLLAALQMVARLAEMAYLPGPIYLSIEERNQIRDAIAKVEEDQDQDDQDDQDDEDDEDDEDEDEDDEEEEGQP